ncbi:MAG: endo-1,4-beta-xylanase [Isosphaeraceae bacterium]
MARSPWRRSDSAALLLAVAALWLPPVRGQDASAKADVAVSALPSLKEIYRDAFQVGVALGGRLPDGLSERERDVLRREFSTVTPENCLKMGHVARSRGRWDFAEADQFVEFAEANRLSIVGHCLLWAKDERTPHWFFRDGEALLGRDALRERLRDYISRVVGRYRGKIAAWDVVNEALSDDPKEALRPSSWVSILGEDAIADAFTFAHEADPDALLILNDYNIENPAKRERLLALLGRLKAKNVPIHGVGIQGHWEIDHVPYAEIKDTIAALRAMGVKVLITELDLDMIPRSKWWADGGKHHAELSKLNPYPKGLPDDLLKLQADRYGELFRLFKANADVIDRVTFWNLHDGQSWLNDFPWRRVNHPLLFDRQGKPKPAFWSVAGAGE